MSIIQLIMLIGAIGAPLFTQDPQAEPEKWDRAHYAGIADRHFVKIVGWFQLDDKMQGWLREELVRRTDAAMKSAETIQVLEAQMMEKKDNTERCMEIARKIQDLVERRPLSVEQIAQALKPHLPTNQWETGHAKLVKETEEYNANYVKAFESNQRAEKKKFEDEQIRVSVAEPPKQSADQMPILVGKSAAREKLQYTPPPDPQTPVMSPGIKSAPGPVKPTVTPEKPTQTIPSIPAPPPSEWERLVRDTAAKYKFTDAQMRTARSILKDCERRADAYRKSHAADYERLTKGPDAARRTSDKAKLDAPITAIGQELRDRLEQIPNAQQRTAAGPQSKRR